MATKFIRKTMGNVPNIALPNTTNANSDLYTVPANCDSVIIGITLNNKSQTAITLDVLIEAESGQGDDVFLVKMADLPFGSSLEVMSGKVVVANTGSGVGDTIQVRCRTAADAMDAVISVLENT